MATDPGADKSTLKFGIMVINTAELKKLLQDDSDFDGITLQISRGTVGANGNGSAGQPIFRFIAYKHYASKKKQEMITDPKFFATGSDTEMVKTIEVGEGAMSHFGNLKLTRANLDEDIDTSKFPFLVLTPELGTGDHENYIVCKASYAESLNATAAQPQSLSRGVIGGIKSIGINPSPPA